MHFDAECIEHQEQERTEEWELLQVTGTDVEQCGAYNTKRHRTGSHCRPCDIQESAAEEKNGKDTVENSFQLPVFRFFFPECVCAA